MHLFDNFIYNKDKGTDDKDSHVRRCVFVFRARTCFVYIRMLKIRMFGHDPLATTLPLELHPDLVKAVSGNVPSRSTRRICRVHYSWPSRDAKTGS